MEFARAIAVGAREFTQTAVTPPRKSRTRCFIRLKVSRISEIWRFYRNIETSPAGTRAPRVLFAESTFGDGGLFCLSKPTVSLARDEIQKFYSSDSAPMELALPRCRALMSVKIKKEKKGKKVDIQLLARVRAVYFGLGQEVFLYYISEKKRGALALSGAHYARKLVPPDREFNFEIVIFGKTLSKHGEKKSHCSAVTAYRRKNFRRSG